MGKKKLIETPSGVPNCRNGHPLKLDVADEDYECDICVTEVSCGHSFYGCPPCDYSICFDCHTGLQDAINGNAAAGMQAQNNPKKAPQRQAPDRAQNELEKEPELPKESLQRHEATELARMKAQNVVRELLLSAIAQRNARKLQEALKSAQGLLLDGEIQMAQTELAAIRAKDGNRTAQATISTKLSEAASIQELEEALELARCCACPELLHQQIQEAKKNLERLVSDDVRQGHENATWIDVQYAIRQDDFGELLNILSTRQHLLSDAGYQDAQRKLPAMQVRSQIRKELKLAFRCESDLSLLQQVVYAAKRSCLPRDEVAVAEEKVKELLARAKEEREKAKANTKDKKEADMCKLVSIVQADNVEDDNVEDDIPSKTPLQEFLNSSWGIRLVEVMRSGDLEKTRLTIEDARLAGISTREISRLQAHVHTNRTVGYAGSPVVPGHTTRTVGHTNRTVGNAGGEYKVY